jgi:hypothetical protein
MIWAVDAMTLSRVRRLAKSGDARTIRLNSCLSLDEMGAALDPPVEGTTVRRWETGECSPHGDRAAGYLRLLEELARAQTA